MDGSVPAGVIAEAVAAAKAYLRLESDGEDALIARLAASVIELGEAYCGQPLVARDDGAAWAAIPPAVAQGMVMLIAHLFARPDGDRAPPAAVAALWRPYRRLRLTAEPAA